MRASKDELFEIGKALGSLAMAKQTLQLLIGATAEEYLVADKVEKFIREVLTEAETKYRIRRDNIF